MLSDFAIGQHLLENPMCAQYYYDNKFTSLLLGRSVFHLSALKPVSFKHPSQICDAEKNLLTA